MEAFPADTGAITTIAGVIAKMQEIDVSLPRKDGVAYFNRLYLQVTQAVLKASAGTTFKDPTFLDRLDVVFAGFYFNAAATIGTTASCPVAWRPLFEARSEPLEPIQFALAGMNAHINHDLPLAILQTCQELDLTPDDYSPEHADYEQVNSILNAVEGQVAGWFDTGVIADVEDVTPATADKAIAMWSIVAAREIAWNNAQVMWSLREMPALEQTYADVLARTAELSSRAILV